MSHDIIIDPLIFDLQRHGGISRMWRTLLEGLPRHGLPLRVLGQGGGRMLLPARLRRFVPFRGPAGLFVPTYYRPCATSIANVQVVHDCIKELLYPRVKSIPIVARRRAVFANATRIVAVSEATRDDVARVYGDRIRSKVVVVHNPVDVESVRALGMNRDLPPDISGWLAGAPHCLYVGHRTGAKNFEEIQTLFAADREIRVLVVGAPATARDVALTEGAGGRVRFLGPLPDELLFPLLARSTFLFFPSRYEGFGIPIVESLALGVPVLGLATKTNREIAGGLIHEFQSGDVDSVAGAIGAIRRASRDPKDRETVLAQYRPEGIVRKYAEVLSECIVA